MNPTLKTYREFKLQDFLEQPIWVCAYGVDEGKPWYGTVDEVTYRPWCGDPPPNSNHFAATHLLARAKFTFADGDTALGFATPRITGEPELGVRELAFSQPSLFLPNGDQSSFWTSPRFLEATSRQLLEALKKTADAVFPITYRFDCELPVAMPPSIIPSIAALSLDGGSVLVAS